VHLLSSCLNMICSNVETVVNPFLLEYRKFRLLLVEAMEGPLQIEEGLLTGVLSDLVHPRELGPLDPIELFFKSQPRGFFPRLVLAFPLRQCPIPRESRNAARLSEVPVLFKSRV